MASPFCLGDESQRARYFADAEIVAWYVAVLLVFANFFGLMRALRTSIGPLKDIGLAVARCVTRCKELFVSLTAEDEEGNMTKFYMERRRLGRAQNMIFLSAILTSVTSIGYVLKIWLKFGFCPFSQGACGSADLYDSSLLPSVLYASLAIVCVNKPGLVSLRMLDRCNVALTAFWMLRSLTIGSDFHSFALIWTACVKIYLSVQFGNAMLCSMLLTVACLVDIFSLMVTRACETGSWDITRFVTLHAFIFLMSLSVVWTQELASRTEAAACVRAMRSKGMESMVMQLLSGMCDATVHLGVGNAIQGPAYQLSVLLLRFNGASLEGRCFLDFFSGEERERVRSILESSQSGSASDDGHNTDFSQETLLEPSSTASVLHSTMQDAGNLAVPVELFVASFFDGMQRLQIVGVKEDVERCQQTTPWQGDVPQADAVELRFDSISARSPEPRCGGSREASPSSWSTVSAPLGDAEHAGAEAMVWFDAASPQLSVLRSKASGHGILPPSLVGQNFTEWVSMADGRAFRVLLQQRIHQARYGEGTPWRIEMTESDTGERGTTWLAQLPMGEVRITPPAADRVAFSPGCTCAFAAQCALEVPWVDDPSDLEEGRSAKGSSHAGGDLSQVVTAKLTRLRQLRHRVRNATPEVEEQQRPPRAVAEGASRAETTALVGRASVLRL